MNKGYAERTCTTGGRRIKSRLIQPQATGRNILTTRRLGRIAIFPNLQPFCVMCFSATRGTGGTLRRRGRRPRAGPRGRRGGAAGGGAAPFGGATRRLGARRGDHRPRTRWGPRGTGRGGGDDGSPGVRFRFRLRVRVRVRLLLRRAPGGRPRGGRGVGRGGSGGRLVPGRER